MAAGEVIGCFGLTEPDAGSDPGGDAHDRARATATAGCSTARRCGSPTAAAPASRSSGRRADEGIRGFLVPGRDRGLPHRRRPRQALAGRLDDLGADPRGLPRSARTRCCRASARCAAPLACLTEARYGIVWGAVGAARACFEAALDYTATRVAVRRADRGAPDRPAGARRDARRGQQRAAARDAGSAGSRTRAGVAPEHISYGKFNNVRMATDVARRARALLGANGITLEYPVMRHLVNLESVLTYEGTHQIHTLVLGRALTGHERVRLASRGGARFIVYGAGAVGGVIGARLHEDGHDVVLIARGAHREAIARDGLRIESADGRRSCTGSPVVGDPAEIAIGERDDVVLLTVKSQDTVAALERLGAVAGRGRRRRLRAERRRQRARGAAALRAHLRGLRAAAGDASRAGRRRRALRAGRRARSTSAATRRRRRDAPERSPRASRQPASRRRRAPTSRAGSTRSCCATSTTRSARCSGRPPAGARARRGARATRRWRRSPPRASTSSRDEEYDEHHARHHHVSRSRGAPTLGSSWQSLARGSGAIEADHLNGEIVLLGRLHGVPTPVNALLAEVAAEAARDGTAAGSMTEAAAARGAAAVGAAAGSVARTCEAPPTDAPRSRAPRAPFALLAVVCVLSLGGARGLAERPVREPVPGTAAHSLIFDEVYYVNAARRIDGIAVPAKQHLRGRSGRPGLQLRAPAARRS